MKKIGLIGLLIVLSINADPISEGTPLIPGSQTTIEKAKALCLQAFIFSKEKTTQGYHWAAQQMPEKETVKATLNNSLSWLSVKSIIAKNWLKTEAPVKAQQLISSVKTTYQPAWEKTRTTISTLIAKLRSSF